MADDLGIPTFRVLFSMYLAVYACTWLYTASARLDATSFRLPKTRFCRNFGWQRLASVRVGSRVWQLPVSVCAMSNCGILVRLPLASDKLDVAGERRHLRMLIVSHAKIPQHEAASRPPRVTSSWRRRSKRRHMQQAPLLVQRACAPAT